MKIKREIQGFQLETELTKDELYDAYREQEHIFDLMDVESWFEAFGDDEIEEMYGMTRKKLGEKFEDIACEMRRNIDHYDMSFTYARDAAINEIL